jgi:DNA-binding response OmpR family regulator
VNAFILAVVDDLLFSSKITGALEPMGYSLQVIPDPLAAMAHARTNKPGLVIVDLGLERGDPFELIKALKTEISLPVLAYTRHTDSGGQQRAKDLGCDKVVVRSEFFNDIGNVVGSLDLK